MGGLDGVHIYTINQDGTLGEKVLLTKTIEIDELSDFGNSVGIDGSFAIVGAEFDDNERGGNAGSAYIYERVGGNWVNPISLTLPNDIDANSQFGSSVAINGNYVIVGASGDDNERGRGAGSAYIYERDRLGKWSNPITLTSPTSPDSDNDPTNDIGLEEFRCIWIISLNIRRLCNSRCTW